MFERDLFADRREANKSHDVQILAHEKRRAFTLGIGTNRTLPYYSDYDRFAPIADISFYPFECLKVGWEADIRLDCKATAVKAAPMTYVRRSPSRAYWLSVFIGSYAGITLQMLVTTLTRPIDLSELWVIPVLLLVYGFVAVPFVAIGLALFGLPAAAMLRERAQEWWVGALAVVWGCLAGKLMFYAVDHFLFFGLYDILTISILDMGVIYGLPTGLAWWMLHRRDLVRG